jgi:DNA-binding transcriptional ArsR family regulator
LPGRGRSGAVKAEADWKDSAPLFSALGDRTRLRLASRLGEEGPMSITQLTSGLSMTRQGVTKHLHVLASAGILRSAARGRETVWRLDPRKIDEIRRHLDRISAHWDAALARLKTSVEA